MSGKNRRGLIYNLLKDTFDVSLFHKPTMIDDDVYYVIILDGLLFLKLKVIDGLIIFCDIHQTSLSLYNRYEELLNLFIQQSQFTILIDILGNTKDIRNACMKLNVPIVEDTNHLSISKRLYDTLKAYYKNDNSYFGFYLLSVADSVNIGESEEISEEESTETIPEEEIIEELGNIEITEELSETELVDMNKLLSIEEFLKSSDWTFTEYPSNHNIFHVTHPDYECNITYLSENDIFILTQVGNLITLNSILDIFLQYVNKYKKFVNVSVNESARQLCMGKGFTPLRIPWGETVPPGVLYTITNNK